MRVNSAFGRLFNNRMAVSSGIPIVIAIVMPAIFFITSSFTEPSGRDLRAREVNLIVRQIGHQLLQQAGDSTSRVLPVAEIKEGTFGTFLLRFENNLVFRHDSLMALSHRLLPKAQFPSGYTVTVHDCVTGAIVYGFQLNNTSPDILACRGRRQPSGCYTIEFAFPDFYEKVEQKKAEVDKPAEEVKTVKVIPQEGTEEVKKPTTSGNDNTPLMAELRSVKVDPRETKPIPVTIGTEETKPATFDYSSINLIFSGMLALLSFALLIGGFGKSLVPVPVPVPVQNQNHAITKEFVPELTALGKFSFDVKGQRLLLESEVISLTDKECRILELLNHNFGDLIPRETLMQKVWINEGVITGRSLDMFVSKLRKKLSSDPQLRITNVHGKGYKLELLETQILNPDSYRDPGAF